MPFNGGLLRVARLYRDLNQSVLAELVAVSPTSISFYERNHREPDDEVLEALCDVLGVLPNFFEGDDLDLGEGNFRSQSAPKRVQNQMLAQVSLLSAWVRLIRTEVRLPSLNMPSFDVSNHEDIEAAAEACRAHWSLGDGPLRHVLRVLENAGIIVAQFEDDARQIDAFSTFERDIKIVALSTAKGSASRTVFDSVHELGHGVLHREPGDKSRKQKEAEANHFAGAFLLPRGAFSRDFWTGGGTSLGHLVELKMRWGVSIGAMIYRAHQLNLINTAQYRRWMKNISRRGWRSGVQEPSEPDLPRPELLARASTHYLELTGETPADAAKKMGWKPELFERITGVSVDVDATPTALHSLDEYRAKRSAQNQAKES